MITAIRGTLQRFDARFMESAPARRLATLRILVSLFATVFLVVRSSYLFDISALNGYTTTVTTLDTLVLSGGSSDPYSIISNDSNIPSKAGGPWKAAMKALDTSNFQEAATQMQAAVAAAPKFAVGWHALGVVQERLDKMADARTAYEHAIAARYRFFSYGDALLLERDPAAGPHQ